MYSFLGQHWVLVIAAWFLYSAIVSGMPKPEDVPTWGPQYVWLYAFAHTLAGNIDKIFGKYLTPKGGDEPK